MQAVGGFFDSVKGAIKSSMYATGLKFIAFVNYEEFSL